MKNIGRHVSIYIKHMLISVSAVTECALVSVFASLVLVPVGIKGSAVGLWNTLYKYDWYMQKNVSKKWYQNNNGILISNDGILQLNKKYIAELNHENLREITIKYHSYHRKHRYKLVEE